MSKPAAPCNHPEFAQFLAQLSIGSIPVKPDSLVAAKKAVHSAARLYQEQAANLRTPGGGFAPLSVV